MAASQFVLADAGTLDDQLLIRVLHRDCGLDDTVVPVVVSEASLTSPRHGRVRYVVWKVAARHTQALVDALTYHTHETAPRAETATFDDDRVEVFAGLPDAEAALDGASLSAFMSGRR